MTTAAALLAPVVLSRAAVDAATTAAWLAIVDAHPAWLRRDPRIDTSFNLHSSSLRLAALPTLDSAAIAGRLLRDEIGALCARHLGESLVCNIDQCWIRRQYAPSRYPPGHAPHAWHQDGALGFDFSPGAAAPRADDLLAMVTCWIALTACGEGAPGLEWIADDTPHLRPPRALGDDAIRADHAASAFRRPVMHPGDCLAFSGSVLHHTQVSASMRHDRTSLEIRLFDARRIPARLRSDRFVAVPQKPEGTSP